MARSAFRRDPRSHTTSRRAVAKQLRTSLGVPPSCRAHHSLDHFNSFGTALLHARCSGRSRRGSMSSWPRSQRSSGLSRDRNAGRSESHCARCDVQTAHDDADVSARTSCAGERFVPAACVRAQRSPSPPISLVLGYRDGSRSTLLNRGETRRRVGERSVVCPKGWTSPPSSRVSSLIHRQAFGKGQHPPEEASLSRAGRSGGGNVPDLPPLKGQRPVGRSAGQISGQPLAFTSGRLHRG